MNFFLPVIPLVPQSTYLAYSIPWNPFIPPSIPISSISLCRYQTSQGYFLTTRLSQTSLEDLNNLNYSSIHWNLLFGLSKSFCSLLKGSFLHNYNIGTSQNSCVDTLKELIVILSSDLSWDAHYKHIISKFYQNLFRAKSCPCPNLNCSYISLIRSQFFSVIWKASSN